MPKSGGERSFSSLHYAMEADQITFQSASTFCFIYMVLVAAATATAKTSAVVLRATLHASCAELLTGVEVVRNGEARRESVPWLVVEHHALEVVLLDIDALCNGDKVACAKRDCELVVEHALLERDVHVTHVADACIAGTQALHVVAA